MRTMAGEILLKDKIEDSVVQCNGQVSVVFHLSYFRLQVRACSLDEPEYFRVTHRRIIFFVSIVYAMKYPNEPFVRFVFGFVGASDVGARSDVKILFSVLK